MVVSEGGSIKSTPFSVQVKATASSSRRGVRFEPPEGAGVRGLVGGPEGAGVRGLVGGPEGAGVRGLVGGPEGAGVRGLVGGPEGAGVRGLVGSGDRPGDTLGDPVGTIVVGGAVGDGETTGAFDGDREGTIIDIDIDMARSLRRKSSKSSLLVPKYERKVRRLPQNNPIAFNLTRHLLIYALFRRLQESLITASSLFVLHPSRPTLRFQNAKASKLHDVVFDSSHC
jgi:hypothetical protein